MASQLKSVVVVEKPNVKWSDVAGLASAKEVLKENVILPIKFPHIFQGSSRVTFFSENRNLCHGFLLFGPPGTGKTYLAKAVATESSNASFFSISSPNLVSKWIGESEELVKSLFEMAREAKPSIIFIDDIDSIFAARRDHESESVCKIRSEFLVQMEGVVKNNDAILLLGATSLPWILDPVAMRIFKKRIRIPLPDTAARCELFQLNIRSTSHHLTPDNFKELAEISEGYSCADTNVVVREALMQPIRKVQLATHFKKASGPSRSDPNVIVHDLLTPCSPGEAGAMEINFMDIDGDKVLEPLVTFEDVLKSLQSIHSSVNESDLQKFEKFIKDIEQYT